MKMTIDIDCTPEEARKLFGLPDVSAINDMIVQEMKRRVEENLDTLSDPQNLMKQWLSTSGNGFEQFQNMMAAAMAQSQNKPDTK